LKKALKFTDKYNQRTDAIVTTKNILDYMSLSWYDILDHVVPIRISLIEGSC